MAISPSNCNFGWKAKDFNLISVDDKYYNLHDLRGSKGIVIVFICNHCPYVISIAERLSKEAKELLNLGITTVGIMSNDVNDYPEDSFENMKAFSKLYDFQFPYLYDEKQSVAIEYNAVCTPDFFGFNNILELQYRGRIDSGTMNSNKNDINRELFEAMKLISITNKGPKIQINSMGCSIKWKKND